MNTKRRSIGIAGSLLSAMVLVICSGCQSTKLGSLLSKTDIDTKPVSAPEPVITGMQLHQGDLIDVSKFRNSKRRLGTARIFPDGGFDAAGSGSRNHY